MKEYVDSWDTTQRNYTWDHEWALESHRSSCRASSSWTSAWPCWLVPERRTTTCRTRGGQVSGPPSHHRKDRCGQLWIMPDMYHQVISPREIKSGLPDFPCLHKADRVSSNVVLGQHVIKVRKCTVWATSTQTWSTCTVQRWTGYLDRYILAYSEECTESDGRLNGI